jgi:hypothetical protein
VYQIHTVGRDPAGDGAVSLIPKREIPKKSRACDTGQPEVFDGDWLLIRIHFHSNQIPWLRGITFLDAALTQTI